jgi:hypothetical protein
MFNFTTAVPPPLVFTIDGVRHQVPRFMLPQMAEWMVALDEQAQVRATKHLSDDDKARFLSKWRPLPFDIAEVGYDIRTPNGAKMFLTKWLTEKASPPVAADVVEKILAGNDPDSIRDWVDEVASLTAGTQTTTEQVGGEDANDPLTSAPPASSGAPSTGSKSGTKSKQRPTSPSKA